MASTALHGTFLLHSPTKTLKPLKTLAPTAIDSTIFAGISNHGLRFSPDRDGGVRSSKIFRASSFSFPSSSTDDLRPDIDENPEGIISGEWPENFSFLSYEDLRAYLETQISDKMKSSTFLGEVMSTPIRAATADQTIEEISHHFEVVSGLPVVDGELRCIGVISKKDAAKASNGLMSKVSEVMSSPPITLSPEKTVLDAAALMLKKKIHRIPILNEKEQVVGMVTRTDIFQALEAAEV